MADKEKEKQKKPQQHQKGGGGKKEKKPKGPEVVLDDGGADEPQQAAPPPRLIAHYREKVVPALQQRFGYDNLLAVPRLEKIVISMGVGKYAVIGGEGKGKIDQAEKELSVIAGQKPVRCKAKKSVANFKVREGMETGLKVTLRGARMWEFLDRMVSLAFPRVKDFRGLSDTGFDKNGNYNFGFTEQTVFPEVDASTVNFQQGMNITLVTTARKPEEGKELLKQFGFPFRTEETEAKR
jgi:large subunit ribosomal protein L5